MAGEEGKAAATEARVSGKDNSCYSLAGGDNAGLLITHVQLRGENFEEWTKDIGMALRANKKFGFVTGTVTQPDPNSPYMDDWWMMNSMVVSWIFNTIELTLRFTISYVDTAKTLWDDLRQRFSIGNGLRVQQLKTEIANCKQHGFDVATYYGRLKKLWDELGNYEQVSVCSCSGCSCNITTELIRRQEEGHVHQFVMGLDDVVFGTMCSNILSMEPLPNLNQVYSIIIREERHRNIARGKEERAEAVSFAVQSFKPQNKSELTCSHCNRTGHVKDECFEIVGYPECFVDISFYYSTIHSYFVN